METVKDMALKAVTLPDDMRKYLTKATRGDLEVKVRGLHDGARTIYAVGRQIIYTSIGLACGAGALQLHFRGEDHLARVLVWIAVGCGVLLLLSSLFSRPSRGR
jgi:ubiquinone biosynthesis protein